MLATGLGWPALLLMLIRGRIQTYCAVIDPGDYETRPDFQVLAGLYIRIPLLLPPLLVSLLAEFFLLRERTGLSSGSASKS